MSDDASRGSDVDSAPRARVFISYSRKDMAFADRLEAALKTRGIEALIDRSEIYAFEDWWKRIEALIAQADTIVFVISPDAVGSDVCHKEVAFAASLNKRFAPVVCRRADDKTVPEALARLNFIFFDDEAQLDQSADKLAAALQTDIEWIRRHTEFGEQTRRWAAAKGPSGLLLHLPLLEEAERWIASRPPNAPAPTEQTKSFIAESRRAATRRRNILTGSLAVGLLLALGLAGFAFWQRGIAEQQRALAVSNEQRAITGEEQAKRNEAQAKEERDRALLTQSRFLADLANQRTTAGDASAGALLALEALPDANGVERPYAPEAEQAFYAALQKNAGGLRPRQRSERPALRQYWRSAIRRRRRLQPRRPPRCYRDRWKRRADLGCRDRKADSRAERTRGLHQQHCLQPGQRSGDHRGGGRPDLGQRDRHDNSDRRWRSAPMATGC
jgi:hypothetical protein